jgi:hypothetical protein
MRTMLRGKVTLLFVVCAVLIAVPGAAALAQDTGTSTAPTIQSDKADYGPGELVTLTGSNWQSGESVHINVNDDVGQTWSRNVDVTADASGNISDSFNLPDWFVATYTVTASGASGTATTSFTDGNVDITNAASTSATVGATYKLENIGSGACATAPAANAGNTKTATLTGPGGGLATPPGKLGANLNDRIRITASAVTSGWKVASYSVRDESGPNSNPVIHTETLTPNASNVACYVALKANNSSVLLTANFQQTNSAPTVSTNAGNVSGNEGAEITNSGAFSDADGNNTLTITKQSGAGTVTPSTTTPGAWSWSHTPNDNGSGTVVVQATDGTATVTDSFDWSAANVAPTGTLGNNGPKDEGSAVSVSFTGASDASSVDAASLKYAFDCQGGSLASATYASAGTSSSTSCTFNDNGSFDVTGVIIDKDGGRHNASTSVTVTNVAPDVTLNGPTTAANEGDAVSYNYSWTDPGSDDTFPEAGNSVNCGPNGAASNQVFNAALKTGSFKCTFSDDSGAGTFGVSATVTDDDGGAGTDTTQTEVNNVAPTITNISASVQNVLSGNNVSFTGTATDPSSVDTTAGFSWQWSKDGGAYTAGSNPFSTSFSTCSSHSVSAKATDKDGGTSAAVSSGNVNVYDGSFLAPLKAASDNLVQKGRVLPVKISVGCGTNLLTGLTPDIRLFSGDPTAAVNEADFVVPAESVSSADTTGVMRPVDGGYIYNLQVPNDSKATAGAKYYIRVSPFGINAGQHMLISIQIRK